MHSWQDQNLTGIGAIGDLRHALFEGVLCDIVRGCCPEDWRLRIASLRLLVTGPLGSTGLSGFSAELILDLSRPCHPEVVIGYHKPNRPVRLHSLSQRSLPRDVVGDSLERGIGLLSGRLALSSSLILMLINPQMRFGTGVLSAADPISSNLAGFPSTTPPR